MVLIDDFFFQAEDGIRDYDVTGVQTCALPIKGMVGQAGLEPATPRLSSACSNQLSYRPVF